MEATLKAVADVERPVRQAVATLYRKLLSSASVGSVAPHLRLVVMYTVQALTHLQLDIRLDTLGFLQVIVDCVHSPETNSAFEPLLVTLVDMLNQSLRAGNKQGAAAKVCSPETRTAVMQLLSKLWRPPVQQLESKGTRANNTHVDVKWPAMPANDELNQWVLWRQPVDQVIASVQAASPISVELMSQVGAGMMLAFAECAVSQPQKEIHVECMQAALELTAVMAMVSAPEFASSQLPRFEKDVIAHLPFEAVRSSTARSSLCILLSAAAAALSAAASKLEDQSLVPAKTVEFISTWLHSSKGGHTGLEDVQQLSATQFRGLLDSLTTLSLSPQLGPGAHSECFQGLMELSVRLNRKSQARCAALGVLCDWSRNGSGLEASILNKFLTLLPKALWELKSTSLGTSACIVDTLLHFASCTPGCAEHVARSIVPIIHAEVKGVGSGPPRSVYGPLIDFDCNTQRRFLSLFHYVNEISTAMIKAAAMLLKHQSLDPTVAEFGVEVFHGSRHKMAAEIYLSFMVSVLLAEVHLLLISRV